MKVTISVIGRFHLFNLAQQLLKRNYLNQLITSYPKFEVVKYGIPRNKISSVVMKEIFERGWRKLPNVLKKAYNPQYAIHTLFDIFAATYLKEGADIVVVSGPRILKKAKNLNALTVGERGSSHILYQNEILQEEYERFGAELVPFVLPHPRIIEEELESYNNVDYLFIPSSFVKRSFLEYGYPEQKLIHVPYGVDLSQFKQVPKEDSIFRVIFAGGMSLRKGVHYLLQAFTELKLPNAELLLIGAFNEEIKPFFKKHNVGLTNTNLYKSTNNTIKYVGHVPQGELYKYYSQGSVFVMMSIEEGLAMVIPQAMACGLPVICTTNTGGEDVVRDGKDGFVIPIRDVDIVKEKLAWLYENQDTAKVMGESAKERIASGFTWDDYGEKMVNAYKKILEAKN